MKEKDVEAASLEGSDEDKDKPEVTLPSLSQRDAPQLRLDTGKERITFRRQWWQLWSVLFISFSTLSNSNDIFCTLGSQKIRPYRHQLLLKMHQ